MTRSELIDYMARQMPHLPLQAIEQAVKQVFDAMGNALSNGRRIEIRGFGSFSLRHRSARLARNPKTGEKIQTSGKHVVHFKAGKALREAVDNQSTDIS